MKQNRLFSLSLSLLLVLSLLSACGSGSSSGGDSAGDPGSAVTEPDLSQTPDPEPDPEPEPDPVDLLAFYEAEAEKLEFPFMMEAGEEALDSLFQGLSDIALEQCVIYMCGMSPSPVGDLALVEVSDPEDVEAVKAVFQARIDYMTGADGGQPGAWYPGPTQMWQENSRIVTCGSYVMLTVNESCDEIAADFEALFQS